MTDALATLLDMWVAELAQLNTAIASLVSSGQSVSIEAMSKTGVSYSELVKRRAQLVRNIQRAQGGGRCMSIDVSGAQPAGITQLPAGG